MPAARSVDAWVSEDAIAFAVDSPDSIDDGVDRVVAALGDGVELLGLGEALHGSEEILIFRNRLFQRLVEAHGFSAVVLEVSAPLAPDWLDSGFGVYEANRELVEWMRRYNADPGRRREVQFYGFDIPLGGGGLASPQRVLDVVLEYLDARDPASATTHRERLTPLIGEATAWERPAAMADPAQSIGLSAAATELRIATLDLITELRIRRPELIADGGALAFADALHHAELAGKLLSAHAALATPGAYAEMLGIRDLIMADNLEHVVARERGRGRVLVFAHTSHLQRGRASWQLGTERQQWWPAGAQLAEALGPRYAVIGTALGVSPDNGIGDPEPDTLEARLATVGGPLLIPTHRGLDLAPAEVAGLPTRSGSTLNPTYFGLTTASLHDLDWLVFLDATSYPRGAPPLTDWTAD